MVRSYLNYYNTPKENRIFVTALWEYNFILFARKNIAETENILWIPRVSDLVNYYIYPRKIFYNKDYQFKENIEIDKEFLEERNINYILVDYSKFYSLKNLDDNFDKVIIKK